MYGSCYTRSYHLGIITPPLFHHAGTCCAPLLPCCCHHHVLQLIQRAANAQHSQSLKAALLQHVQHDLAAAGPHVGLQELDAAIQLLQEKRQQVATHESSNKLQLLMLFLQHAK